MIILFFFSSNSSSSLACASVSKREFGNEKNKLVIQPLGIIVVEFLVDKFDMFFNYNYTKEMEDGLDKISKGDSIWYQLCNDCYKELTYVSNKLQDLKKFSLDIDNNHTLIIGKHGPVVKCSDSNDPKKVSFLQVKKNLDIESVTSLQKNGHQLTLDDVVDTNVTDKKSIGKYKGQDLFIKKGQYGIALTIAILPILAPSLTAGGLLVFMGTMADFGTPMIIGEGLRTLPTLMYGEFMNELGGNPAMASTLGSILILVNTTALMAQRDYAFRKAYNVVCIQPLRVKRTSRGRRLVLTAFAYAVVGVALIPALTIINVSSFMPTKGPVMYAGFSLQSYETIFFRIPRAIANTFGLTALAVVLDVFLGVLVAYLLARRRSRAHALLDGTGASRSCARPRRRTARTWKARSSWTSRSSPARPW